MSVKNDDKTPQMIEAAQILRDAGFTIVATRGTAGFLKAAGIEAETVNKVYEGRPNVVDRLRDGDINLVFNTTEGAASRLPAMRLPKRFVIFAKAQSKWPPFKITKLLKKYANLRFTEIPVKRVNSPTEPLNVGE